MLAVGIGSCKADEGNGDGGGKNDEPLTGIADLHLHMFAEEAFGGGWFHGTVLGDGPTALGPCDGGNPGDHGVLRDNLGELFDTCEHLDLDDIRSKVPLYSAVTSENSGPLVSEVIASIPGSAGDTGNHIDRRNGWPSLEDWPRWDVIAHQQAWHRHVEEAYEEGVRVEVISADTLNWLCRALPDENVTRPECDEMEDIKAQLVAANEFAESHDWMEIALTPEDLRRIVRDDKMAVVLSIESSHIFGDEDWRPQLDEVYELGVRTLQPVHQLDNRFGGAALHNTIFHLMMFAETCHVDEDCALTSDQLTLGFDVDENCRNVKGLTDEGRELIQEMMDRGMMVDAAHLSEQSVRDLYELSKDNDYYPIYLSHAHFREIMSPEKSLEEKTTPSWVVGMVRETGGMIGLRTAHEETSTYDPSPVDNTCQGSSRSFAQAYDFGRLGLKVKMGLGSDLNGFIQQTRPRFGPDACSASFELEAQCQAVEEAKSGPPRLGTPFDEIGLGHAGVLVDLLDDLDQLGSDTSQLRTSAEDFAVMWERSAGKRKGPAESIDDLDDSGVTILPDHDAREAEFPTECDEPYCPASIPAGELCRFDAECVSGTCANAGDCGTPRGTCE